MSDTLQTNCKDADILKNIQINNTAKQQEFLSNPKVQKNHTLLQDLGVFQYINSLNKQINDYQILFSNGLSIFHHITIDDMLDTAVLQLANHIKSVSSVFLWKSFQNKDEVTIKEYKNNKLTNTGLYLESMAPFELFFRQHPKPIITYSDLVNQMNNPDAAQALDKVSPELIIPILGHSSLYGLILIGSKIGKEPFSIQELVFIRNFMAIVSLAIQNNLNYDHSVRDVKTGLYNYGFFMTRLTEELARMKRNSYVSSIIVIDVDFFKKFNDTYGHLAGDRVLEHIAAKIKKGVRIEDVPSRFGGEEFTVLLPDTNIQAAWGVAERLRTIVAQLVIPWEIPLSPVTISLGLFTFDKTIDSITEIVDRADKAMYKSKERGRNCTTIWKPGL
jgi:diguanylate cyclase (GGDEF)-like protein